MVGMALYTENRVSHIAPTSSRTSSRDLLASWARVKDQNVVTSVGESHAKDLL